jgi:hypothetical protein
MDEIKLLECDLGPPDIEEWRLAFLCTSAVNLTKPIVFTFSCVKCGYPIELSDTVCSFCGWWNTWKCFTTATC